MLMFGVSTAMLFAIVQRLIQTRLGDSSPLRVHVETEDLWAIGYDDMGRADQVRGAIEFLGWNKDYLMLDDVAVVVRHPDGSFTLNREKFLAASNGLGCSAIGFLAGLVLGAPLTGATIGAAVGGATTALSASVGIGEDFVKEVEGLMQPGTSAIFVLDDEGDMEVILHRLRGLGGTVLKTNVDLARAQLIQSTLAAPSAQTSKSDAK